MSPSSAGLSLNESPARMGVDAIELGHRWARVMPAAEAVYGVAPVCDARKTARGNSRRAWLLETCTYLPTTALLLGEPVQLVRHYFIDQELLRIDIGLSGGDTEKAAVTTLLDERFGPAESSSEAGEAVTRWRLAMDEIALRLSMPDMPEAIASEAAFGDAPLVMLYLRDVKAAEEARAIAGW